MEKQYFFKSLLLTIIFLIIIGITGYIIDPYQQIRYNNNYCYGEQRIVNFGLAQNYKYKTVVIGTSTSENMLKKDIDTIFNTNSINLSISGSTALEQRNLLKIIIKNPSVKKVIYGLDIFSFNRNGVRIEQTNYLNKKLKYIFNISTFKGNLSILKKLLCKTYNKNWIYSWSYWGNQYTYSEENTLNFDKNTQFGGQNLGALKESKEGFNYDLMKKNYDEFLKIVEENKNIEYLIYFPPYSSLYWYILEKYDNLENILKFKKYIYLKSKDIKNIKIYDFQYDENIINNLTNYKDSVHYGDFINKEILKRINDNNKEDKVIKFDNKIVELIDTNRKKFDSVLK